MDLFNFSRRQSHQVNVGGIPMGGDNPIRLQSMTTTNTNDTEACVEQTLRIVAAGGEYVRLTTQGVREAENLKNINAGLRAQGCMVPLVADVHFNPRVAEVAAQYAEKVRINPGNYVDPARTFKKMEYTDEEYQAELKKIEERLLPLLQICRTNHTALRIGVNHGSLSDRIMSRYGDTPAGIVESCMEFLRICKREHFDDVVISIKASNTVVMVRSVRLLVQELEKEGMDYPLHLGVTEAGEGEDGRIKSAVGIGALLADGIGDTIRVSLSEEPECEIPVAKQLVEYVSKRTGHTYIPGDESKDFCWVSPERRKTVAVGDIGGNNVPCAIGADYKYVGKDIPAASDDDRYIVDYDVYDEAVAKLGSDKVYPIFPYNAMPFIASVESAIKFLVLPFGSNREEYQACLKSHPEVVVVSISNHQNRLGTQRAFVHDLMNSGITNPVIFAETYSHDASELSSLQLEAAVDFSALMIDGLCDGIWILNDGDISKEDIAACELSILQAARLRMTKTEYISCPGCGRTLYDLRSTIARIKEATKDLKGLKIGIMGCIVNGPGEMADADFGYVGAGRGKISLYHNKECVEKNIPEEEAVDHLLKLINQFQ